MDFVEAPRAVRVVSFLGTALPLHCTAAGKIYLVFDSENGLNHSLPERLQGYTDKTIVDHGVLSDQMKEIGEAGYALEQEEFTPEVCSVAVPIRD